MESANRGLIIRTRSTSHRTVRLLSVASDRPTVHHASLLSRKLQSWLRSLGGRGHALVILLPVHHRPGDARRLVLTPPPRQGSPASTQSNHPWIGIGRLRAQQIGAGTVDQKPSQILVASLGY